MQYHPEFTMQQMIDRSYNHIKEKFGKGGYAKVYINDDKYEKYLKDVEKLLEDKVFFSQKYIEVNKFVNDF